MKKRKLRFVDLFAGIGGMRLAFEKSGTQCVFTSEWDKFAQITYNTNFGDQPHGDITEIQASDMPDFDILVAGFPCQPFSISGVSKKNALGRPHGFLDKTQGTLFFDVARIINEKKPAAFLLENVKNLVSHDKGRTFQTICDTLTKELGYHIKYRVINASSVLPQNRERIFIAGFKSPDDCENFSFPDILTGNSSGKITDNGKGITNPRLSDILDKKVDAKYHLTDGLWKYLQEYKEKHRLAGNGFGFGLADKNGIARTLSARYYKDGSEILIPVRGKNPRRLTPRECARLMGFPDDFIIPVSDTQAYKQFGNSVAVPVVEKIASALKEALYHEGLKKQKSVGTKEKFSVKIQKDKINKNTAKHNRSRKKHNPTRKIA